MYRCLFVLVVQEKLATSNNHFPEIKKHDYIKQANSHLHLLLWITEQQVHLFTHANIISFNQCLI